MSQIQWQLMPQADIPKSFITTIQALTGNQDIYHLAQLLWQRNLRDTGMLKGFLDADCYVPTSAFDFGQEMKRAVERLLQAIHNQEKIAIWGDFDADGVTATSVLWEGFGQFFPQNEQLTYYIPNRLKESHGLNHTGLDHLRQWGATLIVTCDTGSTNLDEIAYANVLGIDIIVTDHHTLPEERPDVISIINPRYFAETHPLYHLSGVAVAYKLVEALYETLPEIPQQPLAELLDLVAIGLIADLVALKGDCRYLAQRGIEQLKKQMNDPNPVHLGVKFLLQRCQKNGDRPTDISFGIGPRINAVSRIHGDASFCVELLTSRDPERCQELVQQAEMANTRRKEIQNIVFKSAQTQVETLDLSTTGVLILRDRQWQGGVLGLVASQIAQEYARPTVLLTYDPDQDLWKGSARSVQGIDLYELVASQASLLHRFGGHPFAAGLSLKPENLELFELGINQQARQYLGESLQRSPTITVDLTVTVAELGKALFQELKFLEPCGMGNPVPRFLVKNCSLENVWFQKLRDKTNRKLNYFVTNFLLCDDTGDIPGMWWGEKSDQLPRGECFDVVVELDYYAKDREYIVRLQAIAPAAEADTSTAEATQQFLIDYRQQASTKIDAEQYILQTSCPIAWRELYPKYQQAIATDRPLALAYSAPAATVEDPWTILIGIAKYLERTKKRVNVQQIAQRLKCGECCVYLGLDALENAGFSAQIDAETVSISAIDLQSKPEKIMLFQEAIAEEQFQKKYFHEVPLAVLQQSLSLAQSRSSPDQNTETSIV